MGSNGEAFETSPGSHVHGDVGVAIYLRRRVRLAEAVTRDVVLFSIFPKFFGDRESLHFNEIMGLNLQLDVAAFYDGSVARQDAMLVAVREFVDHEQQIQSRLTISMERLYIPNLPNPNGQAAQRSIKFGSVACADSFFVSSTSGEDRKEVPIGWPYTACLDQFRADNVIERRPQIVHYVANEHAEVNFFFELARNQKGGAPSGLLVDIGDPNGVRVSLGENDSGFTLQGFQVLTRAKRLTPSYCIYRGVKAENEWLDDSRANPSR